VAEDESSTPQERGVPAQPGEKALSSIEDSTPGTRRLAIVEDGFEAVPGDEPEFNDYDPEPVPDTELPDDEPEPLVLPFTSAKLAEPEPVDEYADDYEEDGSEDLEEEEEAADDFFEDAAEDEDDEQTKRYKAMLTPEVMEKMLANMRANGIII
jgi:hypothetical protein